MKCPNCGTQVQEDAIFCDQCGTRLPRPEAANATANAAANAAATAQQPAAEQPTPAQEGRCSNCGNVNTPGEMFCGECGAPLAAPQPEPAADVQPPTVAAAPAPSGTSRTCPDCGATVAEGEEFCYACGAELKAATSVAAAASAPAQAPAPAEEAAPAAETAPAASAAAPAQPVDATPPAQESAPAVRECPACGAQTNPGDAFCEFCGAALAAPQAAETAAPAQPTEAAPAAPPVVEAQPPVAAPPTGPKLVVSSGAEIPLAANKETVVGREDPYSGVFPDVDLTPHGGEEGGVSRRHFKITVSGGQYMIEDLNSTNYTLLNRNRLQPGTPAPLNDGDEIRAGRLRLVFRMR
ncbi:MAG: zinc-ribbon domain-containing protein [Chloroflexi bacterium]|jgi:predicted amidophosphoribosyltransferase|nr:zinc-ribbon domain-containing protein [Chloroflexota bacterium]